MKIEDILNDNETIYELLKDAGMNPIWKQSRSFNYLLNGPRSTCPNWCIQITLPPHLREYGPASGVVARSLRTPHLHEAYELRLAKVREILKELELKQKRAEEKRDKVVNMDSWLRGWMGEGRHGRMLAE